MFDSNSFTEVFFRHIKNENDSHSVIIALIAYKRNDIDFFKFLIKNNTLVSLYLIEIVLDDKNYELLKWIINNSINIKENVQKEDYAYMIYYFKNRKLMNWLMETGGF